MDPYHHQFHGDVGEIVSVIKDDVGEYSGDSPGPIHSRSEGKSGDSTENVSVTPWTERSDDLYKRGI